MKGGFLLALLGAWITTQVIGGEALQRLGVLPLHTKPRPIDPAKAKSDSSAANTAPPAAYTGAVLGAGVAPVMTAGAGHG